MQPYIYIISILLSTYSFGLTALLQERFITDAEVTRHESHSWDKSDSAPAHSLLIHTGNRDGSWAWAKKDVRALHASKELTLDNSGISGLTNCTNDTTNIAATTCDTSEVGMSQTILTNVGGCDSVVIITTTLATGPDSDMDGVLDLCDLDDDNDGILDVDEGCQTSSITWADFSSFSGNVASGTIGTIPFTYTSSSDVVSANFVFQVTPNIFPAQYTPITTPVILNSQVTTNTLSFGQPLLNPIVLIASIGRPTQAVEITTSTPFEVVFSESVVFNSKTSLTGTEGYVILQFTGIYQEISFSYLQAEFYANFTFGAGLTNCTQDTDGDLILDALDTDADGDGCPDALEGGGGFLVNDLNNNDALVGKVDSLGIPLLASGGQSTGTSQDSTMLSAVCCDLLSQNDTTYVSGTTCDPAQVGTRQQLLTNQSGCDSLVILTTALLPSDTAYVSTITCDPTQAGTSQFLLTNQSGCDSLIILTTTLLPSDTTYVSGTTCDPAQAGTSQQLLLTNQSGCDSLVIFTTTLLPSDTTQVSTITCDSTQAGTSQFLLTNQSGCDSLIILTTTLLPSDTTQISTTTCDSTEVGTSQFLLTNQSGCDSLIITTITLDPPSNAGSNATLNLTEGDSVDLDTVVTVAGGNYELNGSAISNLFFTAGLGDTTLMILYMVPSTNSCPDGIATITITIKSTPLSIESFVRDGKQITFRVFPNPTDGQFFVQSSGIWNRPQKFELLNLIGQVVYQGEIAAGNQQAQIHAQQLSHGLYMLRIINPLGQDAYFKVEKTD